MFEMVGELLENLFLFLDSLVYGLIGSIYKTFYVLSNSSIVGAETIKDFSGRIYALIGIFMLFKVTFSLLNMFAEPEKLNDAKGGGAALVKRIIISMILIVSIPTIFDIGYKLQGEIIKQNIIGNIVFGNTIGSNPNNIGKPEDKMGEVIKIRLYSSFFLPGKNIDKMPDEYFTAINNLDFDAFSEIAKNENVNYLGGFSTAAGLFALWVLIAFTIDVAVRSIKLALLQLIAPIPILNYIDLKKGTEMFNKWVSTTISTYIEVFIRLLVLYFGIYILSELFNGVQFTIYDASNGFKPMTEVSLFVQVFVIIGILLFIKEAPKFLTGALGIKGDGGLSLSPTKRLRQAPILGRLGGAVAGGIGGAYAGYKLGSEVNNPWGGMLRGGISGGTSGANKYDWAGSKDGVSKKAFRSSFDDTYKTLSGKDYKRFGINDILPKTAGDNRIARMKALKDAYTGERNNLATKLNAVSFANANLRREMEALDPKSEAYKEMEVRYNANVKEENTIRGSISKYEGRIATVSDEIKDINRFYRIDTSSSQKIDDIEKEVVKDKTLNDAFNKALDKNNAALAKQRNKRGAGEFELQGFDEAETAEETVKEVVEQPKVVNQTNVQPKTEYTSYTSPTQNKTNPDLTMKERRELTPEERIERARNAMDNKQEGPKE